eukprot:768054-Hanusia_phi.AAC.6
MDENKDGKVSDSEIAKFRDSVVKSLEKIFVQGEFNCISDARVACTAEDIKLYFRLTPKKKGGAQPENEEESSKIIDFWINSLYKELSSPFSDFRQDQFTKKAISCYVLPECERSECKRVREYMPIRDQAIWQADNDMVESMEASKKALATRMRANKADSAVLQRSIAFKLLEAKYDSIRTLNRSSSELEAEYKAKQQEQQKFVEDANQVANLAKQLLTGAENCRSRAVVSSYQANMVCRTFNNLCYNAMSACSECGWNKEVKVSNKSRYRYVCPDKTPGSEVGPFTGNFYDADRQTYLTFDFETPSSLAKTIVGSS